jgi:N-acetylated-alpha-linked acidic dipeptidase
VNRLSICAWATLIAGVAGAQSTGYSPAAAATERQLEATLIAGTNADSAREYSRALSEKPHMAGTAQQAWTRDYVIQKMKAWGLDTQVREYKVWMPHPVSVRAWRVSPEPAELNLAEGAVAEDTTSWRYPQIPTFNGSAAAGDVTGEVVYVNYGLIEDYALLDSMGVSVKGKIAIARYGRSFRGIKAREAERHGAVGLIIYSDPANDGFVQGDVYPAGPFRPSQGVQRGSVLNQDGDPSTPGYASIEGARRVPVAEMNVPHIPVIPMSSANVSQLLSGVSGHAIPQAWQGGLPFRYHIGPGPVVARISLQTDAATTPFKSIWDTFGVIRGTEFPDELVIIGGHRDAWGPGAADNISGTVSVMEAARVLGAEAKAGHRPRRTLVFATWDAEEWGLVGSTEYVEEDSLRLRQHAVIYLNQDDIAGGTTFGGGGSPSLRQALRDVTKVIPSPFGAGSVYDAWRRTSNVAADSLEPEMGDPGGGSDFAGFYNHLGIPHADWGYGGSSGVYHSAYDSYHWMAKFGDPTYAAHKTNASMSAAMLSRFANADLLPFDYQEFARTMETFAQEVDAGIAAKKWNVPTAALHAAIARMGTAAAQFARARDGFLRSSSGNSTQLTAANAALMRVERSLARPKGLVTRPWFQNLIYAADEDNGYSTMTLPSINEAMRAGNQQLTAAEVTDLAGRFDQATRELDAARSALGGGR